jgi:hypothetical protein
MGKNKIKKTATESSFFKQKEEWSKLKTPKYFLKEVKFSDLFNCNSIWPYSGWQNAIARNL